MTAPAGIRRVPMPLHDGKLQLIKSHNESALGVERPVTRMSANRPRARAESDTAFRNSAAEEAVVTTASTLADLYINELLEKPLTTQASPPSFTRKFARLAKEVERRHVAQYDEMCKSLIIDGRTVYPIFSQVVDELFKSGVNWGRILGLYAFAGSLCRACVKKGMPWTTVDAVKRWIVAYVRSNLATWIVEHGGWIGFDAHFETSGKDIDRKQSLQRWKIVGLAALSVVAIYAAVVE